MPGGWSKDEEEDCKGDCRWRQDKENSNRGVGPGKGRKKRITVRYCREGGRRRQKGHLSIDSHWLGISGPGELGRKVPGWGLPWSIPWGSPMRSNQDCTDDVFLCKLFLLLTHVVVPGNYRVKGIKKDIISPHQSLTVLHLHLALAARLSAFTGATLISVT